MTTITATMSAKQIKTTGMQFCVAAFAEKNDDVKVVIGWQIGRINSWQDYARARKTARLSRLGTLSRKH